MRGRAGQAPGPAAELLTWTSLPESEPECIQLEVASSWQAAADLDATRRFGLLRSWVRVGLEVGRGHGRLPPRPQPRPGPGLKFRVGASVGGWTVSDSDYWVVNLKGGPARATGPGSSG